MHFDPDEFGARSDGEQRGVAIVIGAREGIVAPVIFVTFNRSD